MPPTPKGFPLLTGQEMFYKTSIGATANETASMAQIGQNLKLLDQNQKRP